MSRLADVPDSDTTTVTVSVEVWRELQSRKDPGDSFDDVLRDVLEISNGNE
jgi:predicted CopG family antitoxin